VQRYRWAALHGVRNLFGIRLRGVHPYSPGRIEHPWQASHAFFGVDAPLHVVTDGDIFAFVTTELLRREPGRHPIGWQE
jgi:hypothetical protein